MSDSPATDPTTEPTTDRATDHDGDRAADARPHRKGDTLAEAYDVALLDLDGVVYAGDDAIPHAPESLEEAERAGMRLAFVTNNAARTPETVRDHLVRVNVAAEVDQIITSAQVAVRVLRERLSPGATVYVVGDEGLRREVTDAGFVIADDPGTDPADRPDAVVQGHSPKTGWAQLASAAVAVNRGAWWVASNLDLTIPSARGILPGNGSMVRVVANAVGRMPDVVTGKPDPTMHRETVRRTGATRPLVVGDRLDTDIEGAVTVGVDSLLVLTGVTTPQQLVEADPDERPTYVAADLRALVAPPRLPDRNGAEWTLGRWQATVVDGGENARDVVELGERADAGPGAPEVLGEPDWLDLLRVACAAAWDAWTIRLHAVDDAAAEAARSAGLTLDIADDGGASAPLTRTD